MNNQNQQPKNYQINTYPPATTTVIIDAEELILLVNKANFMGKIFTAWDVGEFPPDEESMQGFYQMATDLADAIEKYIPR